MTNRTCDMADCSNKYVARGMCYTHYSRAKRAGELESYPREPTHELSNFDPDSLTATCAICGPAVRFYIHQDGKETCSTNATARWQRNNELRRQREGMKPRIKRVSKTPPKAVPEVRAANRLIRRQMKYRMTAEEINDLFVRAGFACMACGDEVTDETAQIDHDHACCEGGRSDKLRTCGKCVRGILCRPCNVGLGNFKDDPIRLQRAIDYLAATYRARAE